MIDWLISRIKAIIFFTIDNIHPAKSSDYYEAGSFKICFYIKEGI